MAGKEKEGRDKGATTPKDNLAKGAAGGEKANTKTPLSFLDEFVGKAVVVDMRSPYVCLGKLVRFDEQFLELTNADLHDLRDTATSRENYVAESRATGVKRNRQRILLVRGEIVAVSCLSDVVAD